jgi:hypothetical protein
MLDLLNLRVYLVGGCSSKKAKSKLSQRVIAERGDKGAGCSRRVVLRVDDRAGREGVREAEGVERFRSIRTPIERGIRDDEVKEGGGVVGRRGRRG